MADHDEFPTTSTGWQEVPTADPETGTPHGADRPAGRTGVDATSLVAGLVFVLLAVAGMAELDLPDPWVDNGGPVWVVLVVGGIALLVRELRRARRRR
ncbi:hypothetical protein [Blastococcus sp. SYSU DS0617]